MWSCLPLTPSQLSQVSSVLKGGLTSCQSPVESLPGDKSPLWHHGLVVCFSSMRFWGKFQFLGVHFFNSLNTKERAQHLVGTSSSLPGLMMPHSSPYFFWEPGLLVAQAAGWAGCSGPGQEALLSEEPAFSLLCESRTLSSSGNLRRHRYPQRL